MTITFKINLDGVENAFDLSISTSQDNFKLRPRFF